MKERITKMSIFRTVMSVLLLAVALGMAAKVAQAAKNRATTFVLEKIQGDVRVVSSSKEEKSILEGMQLINGDHQTTGAESYAWMSLDASKAVKLDENSESALKNVWFSKKLEVYSVKGKLFFNVSVPVAEDEAFNIRTSTMVTGIRGTCGWVEVSDDWKSTIYLLTGKLECLVVNPLDNGSQTITLLPGQYAEFFVFPKSEIEGEEASCGVTTKTFVKEEIPGFVLEELLGNDELIQKIYEETKQEIDLRDLTPAYVQKRIKEDQEKHKKEKQEIEEKAAEELTIVEKEPVWKPENKAASAVAYLLMPQKAETVQKYLNQEKYQKVVLVPGSGSEDDNTLKVDIALTTPAGKTLEAYAGVSVDVLANNSLTVDGTAHLTKLTNEGTVTVRSANTLEIEELLINLGVLEITESGRLVLKKGMETSGSFVNSGVVEAAPDATGEEMIRINGGKVVMLSGMISSNRHDTIMHLADGAKAEFQFAGGSIANEMEDGASILAREEDFQVTVLGTDILGVTNTILGKGAVLEKYNAASVFRKDERYHLIELDKVDSYPVVVSKVEHGTIIAPSRVEVGAKVTLTAIPDDGYQLEYLSVNNYNSKTKKVGSSVSLSAEQSFIMPSSDVIVGGSFIEIEGEPKYQVTVRRANGGSVRVSSAEAKAGEEIQISVQKNAGHELEGITVTDADGAAVGISEKGKGFVFTMPEKNVTVTPAFRTLEYNVVFYDDDERTVLNQQTILYGSIPEYKGMKPEKSADSQYSYTFAGWKSGEVTYAADARLPEVTGNTIYTAVYAKKVVEAPYVAPTTYTVTWRNWDGTELEKDTGLTNGATPSYDGLTPTRDADVEHSYDFAGWISAFGEYGSGEPLPAVTGDITYTARFTFTTRSYTITWLNADGEELEKDLQVLYGTTPVYDGETPQKEGDAQYSYKFAGWNTAVVPVVGDAAYTATYTPVLNSYTIRFLNEDETEIEVLNDVDYGTMPAYTTIPTKTGDAQYSYDFAGWEPELTTVTGDADYTAVFTPRINQYKVTWVDADGTPLQTQNNVDYDTIPSYPGASNPAKAADAQYTYAFAGWKVGTTPYANGTTLPAVRGDVTFTAYYSETLNQYNVTFLDDDGTTPIQDTTAFDYGTAATNYAPADPAKTATAQYTYTFAGWTPDNGTTVYTKAQLPTVTGEVVYKATYTTTIHPTGVSLDAQSLELYVGGTAATLTATISPSNAANKNVIWSSNAESIATVAGNGMTATVTAVSNGTATITAKTEDGGLEATCTVTVKTHVTGVSLDQAELIVILGTTETLQATVTPATASNQNLIWTSGDNDIVFVSTVEAASAEDVGKVTVHPVAAGTTTITVTTEDGSFEKSCAVIVKGYTVTFVNDDDAHTQLNQQLNVAKDAIPSFAGVAQPSKTATKQFTYTFAGWKNGQATYPVGTALPEVTGDVTFTAYYDETVNQYNVTFVDEDGTSELKAATAYDYGTLGSAIVAPETGKTSSAEFDYAFTGWIVKGSDGSVKYMTNADLPAVTEDVSYQATYSQTTRTYAINFHYDGSDNTKIHTQQVAYGTVPVYDGTEPTKTGTAQISYVFAGWQDADGTPGLSSVTGEKDYYATFGESGNTFDITYHLNAGTDASAKIENAVVSYVYGVGTTLPTSAQVIRDGYEFSGWFTTATPTANDTAVTTIGTTESGVKEFYAKWTAKKNTLTLTKAGVGSFSQIAVGSLVEAGELSVDAEMDDPDQSVTYEYETDQTVYVRASVYKGSVGDDITEMTTPNSITIQDVDGNPITPTYADGLYSFTMPAKACTVTVTTVNYQVNIDEAANGSVTTDHDNCAEAGDTVALNIVDVVLGYEFGGFTFKNDANENVTIATTKVNDSQYTFTMPAYNVTVEPAFALKTFTVTFFDEDGTTVLKEATTYEFGTPAIDIATPDDPTKEDDADYHYTFNGWTPALAEVTTNQIYKATYTATAIVHVTGVSLDATEVEAVVGGDSVMVNAIIAPEAAENQNVTWSIPEADAAIASVDHDGLTAWVTGLANGQTTLTVTTEDGNYTASVPVTVTTNVAGVTLTSSSDTAILGKADVILTATLSPVTASNKNVTWTVEDQNVLILADADAAANESGVAKATIVPRATGSTKITVTTVNGSHTADITITVKGHTVTWVDEDDTVLFEQTNVEDGTIPSYPGTAEPSKAQTAQYTYSFAGWKIGTQEYPKTGTTGLPGIMGDTTIQAYYTPIIRQYNVTFVNEDGTSELKAATAYNYNTLGSAIVEPEAPTKAPTDTTAYTFAGWTVAGSDTVYETGHLPNVTDDVTYIAKYESATRKYSVTFVLEKADGTKETLKEVEVEYEGIASYYDDDITTAPTREEDDSYVYRFNMWQPDTSPVPVSMDGLASYKIKADTEFKAVFTLISKGLFYYFTNDGAEATPVLHLNGRKEESMWYALEDAKLDSSKYTNGTTTSIYEDITKVVIETEIHPTSVENAFAGCGSLVAIENIENLKTDQVTSMQGMFSDCTMLTSLDVSSFDTTNVTNMANMFYNCYNLTSLNISGFDTSNVTDVSGMFQGCSGLTSLNVSGFVTENVTNMDNMFTECYGLESLNVSSFNTENVTSMVSMFEYCAGLTSLDVSGFDTSNVTDMSYMFNECTNLTLLNLSGWNTGNVTNMSKMFGNMRMIETLDLSSFDTAKVENMNRMFSMENEGAALQAIYVSEDFVTTAVTNSEYMFTNCTNLVGGKGTAYDSNHVDYAYARVDGGTDAAPGYFSVKSVAYEIHVKYLDSYGGSTSQPGWKTTTEGADVEFTVNGHETSILQAYPGDEVVLNFTPKENYGFISEPLGSLEEKDDLDAESADFVGYLAEAAALVGSIDFVMEDSDAWIYVKLEKTENTEAGSVTTYYKLWDGEMTTYTAIPTGGTVTAAMAAGGPATGLVQGDNVKLTITPKEGYQLSRLRAVYWYVDAGVSYEFGSYGGEDITEITYDATGVGTATYEISEVMDSYRLILEVTFMEDMEYDVQFMQGVQKGRDVIQQDGCGTLTTMVGDNVVTKVRVGEKPELTITPETNYRLQDVQAFYTNDVSNISIPLNQHKTKDNTYLFDVESTYFNGGNPKHILVAATFIHGYTVTKNASSVGGSFSLTPASSESLQEVVSGDTVTISVTPETGLTVDQILVEDGGGNLTEVTEVVSSLSYQFVMPQKDVTVSVTFKAETAGTVTTLTEYQSVAKIQQYLDMSGVSEVKLSPSDVTQEYVIDSSLTIPEGKKLTVDAGAMLKVSGNVTIMAGSTLQNDGELINMGTIEANTTDTVTRLINYGTLFSAGSIMFSSPAVVENHGEYVAMAEPSGFDNQSTASTLISASNEYVGTCGEWAGYGVWDNGTSKELKFYGTGNMNNYTMNTAPWSGVRNSVTTITIPQGITSIGNYAFVGFTAITEIAIPEGVTSIGQHAFDGCSSLTTVTLPTSLTFLGGYAFNDCAVISLTYPGGPAGAGIYLPPNLEAVAGYSFYNCPLAATVVVPSKVYQIAPAAFGAASESSTLQEIWLPASLTDIYAAFGNRSGLTTIYYAGSEADWAENYVADGAIPAGATIVYNSSFDD